MNLVLNRVIIFVRDTRACAAFYRDNLGLQPIGEWSDEWAELGGGGGGCRLAFHAAWRNGARATHPTGSPKHPHKIVFCVPDVEAARAALVARGVAMDAIVRVPEAGDLVLCDGSDIEGHRFQICNR